MFIHVEPSIPGGTACREKELLEINSKLNGIFKAAAIEIQNVPRGRPETKHLPDKVKRQPVLIPKKISQSKAQKESISPENICSEQVSERFRQNCKKNIAEVPRTVSDLLPQVSISANGTIKFLKAKVLILQDELERQRLETAREIANIAYGKSELIKKTVTLEQTKQRCEQLDKQLVAEQQRSSSLQIELTNKKEELTESVAKGANTQRELERSLLHATKLEGRLQTSIADAEFLRIALRQTEANAKEAADAGRLEKQQWDQQQKQFMHQRAELLGAYKSQLLLLDNLQRQNISLEQSRGIQIAEKDFFRMLQQK